MIFFKILLIILVAAPVLLLAAYLFITVLRIITKQNKRDERIEELREQARYAQLKESDSVPPYRRKADRNK